MKIQLNGKQGDLKIAANTKVFTDEGVLIERVFDIDISIRMGDLVTATCGVYVDDFENMENVHALLSTKTLEDIARLHGYKMTPEPIASVLSYRTEVDSQPMPSSECEPLTLGSVVGMGVIGERVEWETEYDRHGNLEVTKHEGEVVDISHKRTNVCEVSVSEPIFIVMLDDGCFTTQKCTDCKIVKEDDAVISAGNLKLTCNGKSIGLIKSCAMDKLDIRKDITATITVFPEGVADITELQDIENLFFGNQED